MHMYYRARYYDLSLGRFSSEDPLRFDAAIDFFTYTGNNPINATDPTGREIKVCSRDGWEGPVTFSFFLGGVFNHSYILNTITGENCGRGDQSGKENPYARGTFCREVPGSAGHESEIMDCCRRTRNKGMWFPGSNDCHTSVARCLKAAGLSNPGVPGGRAGCRGKGFCGFDFVVPGLRLLNREGTLQPWTLNDGR